MSLDLNFALVIGVFFLCIFFVLGIIEKIVSIRRNTKREPPIEQEIKAALSDLEMRLARTIPDVSALEERWRRELSAVEARACMALSDLRVRYEKAVAEIFEQIRDSNATSSKLAMDIGLMVARVEASLKTHLESDRKGLR